MKITSIEIHPTPENESQIRATADVVINDSLSLRGIKVMRGRYGLFLAFPGASAKSSYRIYETVSMRFRKQLQDEILKAYQAFLAPTLPLFN
jgi:DNA-binding cell septation regulator SpoVG